MLVRKQGYILGIFLILIIVVVIGGVRFWQTRTPPVEAPLPAELPSPAEGPPKTTKALEIVGIIKSLGEEGEFTLEKEGKVVFQNKPGDQPEIQYRISYIGKMVLADWEDLELDDRAVLTINYDDQGEVESRILIIFREQAPTEL